MNLRDCRLAALGAALLFMTLLTAPAAAQLDLGAGNAVAVAYLESRGYSDVRILANELIQVRAEACRDGVRYRLTVRIDGRITGEQRIGNCGVITIDQAQQQLENSGYRRVEVGRNGDSYIAFGCRGGDRFRLVMNLSGEIGESARVGPCRQALSTDDVAAKLRGQGFDRIEFTDTRPPDYEATACLGDVRFRLNLSGSGEIVRENRIGRCARPIDRRQLVDLLEERGFSRIDVTGENDRGFIVEACRERGHRRMVIDPYGELVRERDLGACAVRQVDDILREAERRGMRDTRIYLEGCRGNRRIRIELDELGDAKDRTRIGGC